MLDSQSLFPGSKESAGSVVSLVVVSWTTIDWVERSWMEAGKSCGNMFNS